MPKIHFAMELNKQTKSSYLNIAIVLLEFLAIIVIFAALIKGWLFFSKPNNFPIQKVKVIATYKHLDPNAVRQTVTNHLKNNSFFAMDISGLQNQLLKLPWVYAVSIKKQWPNTININLTEQIPTAYWQNHALINKDGNIFITSDNKITENIPQFFGPENTQNEMLQAYEKIQQQLQPLNLSIKKFTLNPPFVWIAELNNKISLYLSYEDYQDKLQNFIVSYPKIISTHNNDNIDIIDLRYKNGLSVKWR